MRVDKREFEWELAVQNDSASCNSRKVVFGTVFTNCIHAKNESWQSRDLG